MSHSGDLSKLLTIQRDLRTLTERVDDLEQLREGIGAIAAAVEDLTARQQVARPAPIHWPDLDDDQYRELWPSLLAWLRDVLVTRYPADAGALAPCWWQHGDAVDALTAGWQTWLAAYRNPAAEPTARGDWQGRWRPAMTDQVRSALRSCSPDQHTESVRDPDVVAGVYRTGASV